MSVVACGCWTNGLGHLTLYHHIKCWIYCLYTNICQIIINIIWSVRECPIRTNGNIVHFIHKKLKHSYVHKLIVFLSLSFEYYVYKSAMRLKTSFVCDSKRLWFIEENTIGVGSQIFHTHPMFQLFHYFWTFKIVLIFFNIKISLQISRNM